MYLGRAQLGTWVNFYLQTKNAGTPAAPVDVPWLKIYNAAGSVVFAGGMPIWDKLIDPWLFRLPLFLGGGFAVGQCSVGIYFVEGSNPQVITRNFEIVAGGSPQGQVLGMAFYHRPSSDFLVYQTEIGNILRGRNPRVQ